MSFGEPCRNRGSESLMVDGFDLFRGALEEQLAPKAPEKKPVRKGSYSAVW